ncbi:MAG: glycosyltransferase family 39 protein [Planctomycetota bacterium]|nr:glycosyltransferase family 39 protein [Planctomycetota bacterium]
MHGASNPPLTMTRLEDRRVDLVWDPALAAWTLFVAGVIVRFLYVFNWYPTMTLLFSDSKGYFDTAQQFLDPNYTPGIADTIHPPATRWFFGTMLWLGRIVCPQEPMYVSQAFQFVMCSLLPLLLCGIGYDLFGRRTALFALAFASAYYPLFDYACYVMSEAPFTFFMVLSFYLLIRSLKTKGLASTALGLLAGIALGVTAAFKSVVLPSAFFAFLLLIAVGRLRRFPVSRALLTASIGLILVLTPLSIRASRLSGHFCLIANDAARNVLIGHYGEVGSIHFIDKDRGITHVFGCPAAVQKGHLAQIPVPIGAYENGKCLDLAFKWMKENPWRSLQMSIEHVFDLFYGTLPWPSNVLYQAKPWVILYSQVFLCLVLIPMVVHLLKHRREILRLEPAYCGDALLLVPLFGIMLAAFIALGEPRYRIPYDGFMLLLASRLFVGRRPGDAQLVPDAGPGA